MSGTIIILNIFIILTAVGIRFENSILFQLILILTLFRQNVVVFYIIFTKTHHKFYSRYIEIWILPTRMLILHGLIFADITTDMKRQGLYGLRLCLRIRPSELTSTISIGSGGNSRRRRRDTSIGKALCLFNGVYKGTAKLSREVNSNALRCFLIMFLLIMLSFVYFAVVLYTTSNIKAIKVYKSKELQQVSTKKFSDEAIFSIIVTYKIVLL